MSTRTVLLAIALGLPLSLGAAEEPNPPGTEVLKPAPDSAADKTAAKTAQLDKRLESNAKRLGTQRARREAVTIAVTTAQEGLAKLGAHLTTIEGLAAKAHSERASSGDETPSEATVLALDEANTAAVPLQRSKRDWTRTVTEGKRQLLDLDRQIASLEAERCRIEQELNKAAAAPASLQEH